MTADATALAYLQQAALAVLKGKGLYAHGTKAQATDDHDEPTPQIHSFDIDGSKASPSAAVQQFECILYFADKAEGTMHDGRDAINATIDRMSELKEAFLNELDKHYLLQIGVTRDERLRNILQANLSGVALQFTLTVPAGLCYELPPVDPGDTTMYGVLPFVLGGVLPLLPTA